MTDVSVVAGDLLAVVSTVFALALAPSCFDPETRVPALSSTITTAGLVVAAGCYGVLGMTWAMVTTAVLAGEWGLLAAFRRTGEGR